MTAISSIASNLPPVHGSPGHTKLACCSEASATAVMVRAKASKSVNSFDLIHNPRKHVCGCGVGYVRKPDYCHSCGAPMWFDAKQVARAIMKEMEA